MADLIKIAHISDLHYNTITKNPLDLFSKRALGTLNLLFKRKKEWQGALIKALIPQFKELKVDLVLFTGDATSTSHPKEYREAANFFKELSDLGIEVVALPGNHDHYTQKAHRERRFYLSFEPHFNAPEPLAHFSLKTHGVAVKKLLNGWWIVALDTAPSTSWISSRGHFSQECERHLRTALDAIPPSDPILLANHFPFFQHESQRKILVRGKALQEVLEAHPNIKLYLHGHTHRLCVADLRSTGLPIILDCGSTGMGPAVSWNLLTLSPTEIHLTQFESHASSWSQARTQRFLL